MRAGFLSLLVFAIACAGAPPTRTYYLMRAEITDGVVRAQAPVSIGLGSVDVAPYLSDPGLVLETGAGQVQSARSHVWAEPLGDSLRLYLRAQISRELGYAVSPNTTSGETPDYVVDVAVEELHGTRSGAARLVATWRIARADRTEELAAFRFARTRQLARDGYAALAEAEIALFDELATEIAKSLPAAGIPSTGAGNRSGG